MVNYLYAEEVDSVIEKVVIKGARILLPAEYYFWADLVGRNIHLKNHVRNIASRIKEE